LRHGIVLDVGVLPDLVHGGISAQAELNHEVRDDAEEARVIVKAVLYEVVEPVGA